MTCTNHLETDPHRDASVPGSMAYTPGVVGS